MGKKENKKIPGTGKELEFVLKRSEALGWFLVLLCVCASMFVLGIFVGRRTAAVQSDVKKFESRLGEFRDSAIKKENQGLKINGNTTKAKPELNFYEALKKSDTKPDEKTEKITPFTDPENRQKKGKYAVQVAAVKTIDGADEILLKLRKLGYSPYRTKGILFNNVTWYRIRIGNFETKAEAGLMLNRLTKDRIHGFLVKQ
jgi:septal ring-binding cell division protein DamX